jgi:hypothetical protein
VATVLFIICFYTPYTPHSETVFVSLVSIKMGFSGWVDGMAVGAAFLTGLEVLLVKAMFLHIGAGLAFLGCEDMTLIVLPRGDNLALTTVATETVGAGLGTIPELSGERQRAAALWAHTLSILCRR